MKEPPTTTALMVSFAIFQIIFMFTTKMSGCVWLLIIFSLGCGCVARSTSLGRSRRSYYGLFCCVSTGEYISQSCECDGKYDCADGSDELNCMSNLHGCHQQFQCQTTMECIPVGCQCDGKMDCADGSDETSCGRPLVLPGYLPQLLPLPVALPIAPICQGHLCSNGVCLPLTCKCDGTAQCADGSDEDPRVCGTICQPNQWRCRQSGQCIIRRQVCDRIPQCDDRTDEYECSMAQFPNQCVSHGEFSCNNGQCIPNSCRCNGLIDCEDQSDEWNCVGYA